MKYIVKNLLLSLCLLMPLGANATTNSVFKAKYLMGYIIPTPSVEKIGNYNPLIGGEISWEVLPLGDQEYQHYWRFPSWGLSLMFLDYGNSELLGQAINLYPYVSFPFVNNSSGYFNAKVGAGVSFQTKTSIMNGSYMQFMGLVGLEAGFKFKKGFGLFFEAGSMVFNNCNLVNPSYSTVTGYGAIGMRYHYNERRYRTPRRRYMRGLPWNVAFNISLATGVSDYHFYDHHKPIFGTFHIDAVRRITNCYALGAGLDVIYDSKFVAQGTRDEESFTEYTEYNRYFIDNNNIANKFRVGVSACNLFLLGRFTGLLDLGLYVYDPIRDSYPDPNHKYGFKRPIVYPFNPDKEDGWFYVKLGGRIRLVENFSVQAVAHLHPYNNRIEFGISYALPQKRKLQI